MRNPPDPEIPAGIQDAPSGDPAIPVEAAETGLLDVGHHVASERTRRRLVATVLVFSLLCGAVAAKLTWTNLRHLMQPSVGNSNSIILTDSYAYPPDEWPMVPSAYESRAAIIDRDGYVLAISPPDAVLYANRDKLAEPREVARKLKQVLSRLDEARAAEQLAGPESPVYLEHNITVIEQQAIRALGIPGLYIQPRERRYYPMGNEAAQVIGGVDARNHGAAGVEQSFERRLRNRFEPLRLTIDVRVQSVLRNELKNSKDKSRANGACGIVMDVHTGEVLAMVSLPDYNPSQIDSATPDARFNIALTGLFKPGSAFQLPTAALALDSGVAHVWDQFDAIHNIKIDRFEIADYRGERRMLYLPEVIAYSSDLGTAHISGNIGAQRQRLWLYKLGLMRKVGIELPEAVEPIVPAANEWSENNTIMVALGRGLAISPLHMVRGIAALVNGGILLQPTILARDPGDLPPQGYRIITASTSDMIRKLMRLSVTKGYGHSAEVDGYFVGGTISGPVTAWSDPARCSGFSALRRDLSARAPR